MLRRRLLSSARPGGRLEAAFERLIAAESGRQAVKAYGECLEKRAGDIHRDCCRIEFEALQKE